MCQSKVLKLWVPERTFEACLQNALTFFTERVFSRVLRQYGRNPVVQCRRFGISKPDYYCRCNCDTICSCSFKVNITFLNATCAKGEINKPRDREFALLRGKTEWFRLACFMACFRILSCRYSGISLEAFLLREFRTSWNNSEWFVLGRVRLGYSGIRIYSGIYSGYSAPGSRIAGMEIQVFRIENSSQTNAYSRYYNYSYSGLIPNERALSELRHASFYYIFALPNI